MGDYTATRMCPQASRDRPDMSKCDVIVLDGDSRTAVGVVRSFVSHGLSVVVGSTTPFAKAAHSRGVKSRFRYDVPDGDPDAMHQRILEQVRRWQPRMLMPVFDQSWSIIYRFYEAFLGEGVVVPNPGPQVYAEMLNKRVLATRASELGIPIPKTLIPSTIEEARSLCGGLPYPVLLKAPTGTAGRGIHRATSPEEFLDKLEELDEVPVIQELVSGEDLELTILCDRGRPIAGHAYISLRNAPLPYGPPIACRSIREDSLLRIGCEFLSRIDYHGVAHLDFRRDQRDGVPKLLDFNARLAGTNDMSLYAGVDFGYMLFQLAIGERVEPCFDYETDQEYRWLLPGELRHLAATSHKMRTLGELLRWKNVGVDVRLRDPLPHVVALMEWLRRGLR